MTNINKKILDNLRENTNDYPEGSIEYAVREAADDFGVNFDYKIPFEYFYSPDSEDFVDGVSSDYRDFYNRVLEYMGLGKDYLYEFTTEVNEVSDGKNELIIELPNKDSAILDLRAWDDFDSVCGNVETILGFVSEYDDTVKGADNDGALEESYVEDQLDKNYPAIVSKLRDIFELFGIDKNIINDKLDGGEVNQSDFDDRLYGLMAAIGNLVDMQEKTDDLIYEYTNSYVEDMWNSDDSSITDQDLEKADKIVNQFSEGLTQYLKEKLSEIVQGID